MSKVRKILDGVSALGINGTEEDALNPSRLFGTKTGCVKVFLGKAMPKSQTTNSVHRMRMAS
jgi:hypothetical protein